HTRLVSDWSSDVCSSDLVTFDASASRAADGSALSFQWDFGDGASAGGGTGGSGGTGGGGGTTDGDASAVLKAASPAYTAAKNAEIGRGGVEGKEGEEGEG